MPSKRVLVLAGALATLGAFLTGVGELSLHFTPTFEYHEDYSFFLGTPRWRFTLGHFLCIATVPLYFLGYWHLYHGLRPASRRLRLTFLGLGVLSFFWGGVWLASRVYPALVMQAHAAASGGTAETLKQLLEDTRFYAEGTLTALRLGVGVISVMFAALVGTGRTSYPRWVAFLSPLPLVGVLFALYFALPSVGGYLMPQAMNVAHVVLFGTSTLLLAKSQGVSSDESSSGRA